MTATVLGRTLLAAALSLPALPLSTPASAETLSRDHVAAIVRPALAEAGIPAAVVALVRGDETLVLGLGETAVGSGREPDGRTLFQIGSVSKGFTAALLADMVVAGDVGLSDLLTAHLPAGAVVPAFDDRSITLLDLATHTSRLPRDTTVTDALPESDRRAYYAGLTEQGILDWLSGQTLSARPGLRFDYSNVGVGLLGMALAHANGTSFEEAVATRVAEKYGMADTVFALTPEQAGRKATAYGEDGKEVTDFRIPAMPAAGGLYSSADDLVVWIRANLQADADPALTLLQQIHVSAESLIEQGEGRTPDLALGWMVGRGKGQPTVYYHTGTTGGSSAFVAFSPEGRFGLVLLANSGRFKDVNRIAGALTGLVAAP